MPKKEVNKTCNGVEVSGRKENMTSFEDDDSDMDELKNAIETQDKPEINPKRPKRHENTWKKTAKKEKYHEKKDKK
eukprot:12334048-Ditylum_brightwellii.AAC.1